MVVRKRRRAKFVSPLLGKQIGLALLAIAPSVGTWIHGDGARHAQSDKTEGTLAWVESLESRVSTLEAEHAELVALKRQVAAMKRGRVVEADAVGPPEPPRRRFSLWRLIPGYKQGG